MTLARVFTAAAGCVVLGAAAASCSGSFGSGTGLPQTMASPNFGGPSAAPTPATASSVVLTYGESTAFQNLPEVGGYAAAIAFPKAPPPTPAPAKGKTSKNGSPEPAASPTPVAVAIGATLSIVKPQDGPDLNFVSGKGRRRRTRELPARALAYITLLPTHDATLEAYPRIEVDVPREVASQYRDGEFGLALWNSGEKDAKYRLSVAELDSAATPPPVTRAATPAPSPAASGGSGRPSPAASPSLPAGTRISGSPGPGASPGASFVPGGIVASAAPTLPPARMLFAGTATPLKLMANRPAVFALYALPHPGAKASGSPAPAAPPSAHPAAAGSARPSASGSPVPAGAAPASPVPSAAPAPAKSP
ncbi:MAG TPA: hypothetical protein VGC96_14740 [Candidatus Elarobacter sp.]|jgi:hypothetical protein